MVNKDAPCKEVPEIGVWSAGVPNRYNLLPVPIGVISTLKVGIGTVTVVVETTSWVSTTVTETVLCGALVIDVTVSVIVALVDIVRVVNSVAGTMDV